MKKIVFLVGVFCLPSIQGMHLNKGSDTWTRNTKKRLSGLIEDPVKSQLLKKKKVKELEERIRNLQKENEKLRDSANKIKQGNIVLVEQNRQLTDQNRQKEEVISSFVVYKTNADRAIKSIESELVKPLDNSIAWNVVGTEHQAAFRERYVSSCSIDKVALSASFVSRAIFCLAEESVNNKKRICQLEQENVNSKTQIYQNEQRIYDLEKNDKIKDEKIAALESQIQQLHECIVSNINQQPADYFIPDQSMQAEVSSSERKKPQDDSMVIGETDQSILVEQNEPDDISQKVSMNLNDMRVEKNSINLDNDCSYSGELHGSIPHGMGTFNHGQQAFNISGYFTNGCLDLTQPVKFQDCCGVIQEFHISSIAEKNKKEFSKKLSVPVDSLCKVMESLCSNNSLSLIVSKTSQKQEGVVFNKNFVYQGMLDFDYGLPNGEGFILKSTGEIREGNFSRQGWIKEEWLSD